MARFLKITFVLMLISGFSVAATQSITSRQIRDGTIVDNDIANGTIKSLQISDNTIVEGDISTTFYAKGTCTPTVTLVGGTGNVVPVYSTNSCRFASVGRIYFVDIFLSGDGGAEGAGNGTLNIALPATVSASAMASYFPCGSAFNGTAEYILWCQTGASATTVSLYKIIGGGGTAHDVVSFLGVEQDSTPRSIRLKFFYEI